LAVDCSLHILFITSLLRNCLENRATIGRNFTSVSFLQKLTDDNKTRQWDGLSRLSTFYTLFLQANHTGKNLKSQGKHPRKTLKRKGN